MKKALLFLLLPVFAFAQSTKQNKPFIFGTNGFHWLPIDQLSIFDSERLYVWWSFIEAKDGKMRFDPADGGAGQFDRTLSEMKAKNIEPLFCLFNTPEWVLRLTGEGDAETAPAVGSLESPASYKYFARACFQVAARYGRVKHPISALNIDTTERWTNDGKNKLLTGVDLLRYIEVWNEPNKFWKPNTKANMTARQYAAMLSACYDGHEGTLGAGYGVKTADRSMQVVMAGLAGLDTTYLKEMAAWFKQNRRDGKFAADVMNVHHYCNAGGNIGEGVDYGISPEEDDLHGKLSGVVRVCNSINLGAPVWFTEFGYDTDQSSPQYADISKAGEWLVQTYLNAMSAGCSAAYLYNAADEPNVSHGLYQSSGILYGEGGGALKYKPKAHYSAVSNMSKHLRGKTFIGSHLSSEGTRTMVFADGEALLYATWNERGKTSRRPTVDGRVRYYYIRR